jgi:hypothetical protein
MVDGSWLVIPGCAAGLAFDGKGNLFRLDCRRGIVEKFGFGDKWTRPFKNQKVIGLAGDLVGTLWAIDRLNVLFWDKDLNRWQKSTVPNKPHYLAAGMKDHVYLITKTRQIYRFSADSWIPVPNQVADTIAVGHRGTIFITDRHNNIFKSVSQSTYTMP